jgi:phosphopantothenoylcysteine decarboxylase/phosphopantothenate--cysteine ligase
MNPLQGRRIVLGVSGSIACYKAVDLASKLTQAGVQVDTILTDAARQFITPLTFQSVTGRRAYGSAELWGNEAHVLHVGLAHQADLLVIAPATANTLTKLAQGQSNDLLSITALAATCPLLVAPAMDGGMFSHPATQANLRCLQERGVTIVGPEEGHLASGLVARGRMSEPLALLGQIRHRLAQGGPLTGRKVVVTAGGTREAVDPVRYLTNHSSGRQGYAVAQAALDAGATVTLISTTDALPIPTGAHLVAVDSAQAMLDAVRTACAAADVLIMAAAVADFRPAQVATQKIKKHQGTPTIELAANPDILATVAAERGAESRLQVVVGFAAETQNLLENAQQKLARKGLDLIVANDVTAADAGFAVETNLVIFLRQDGSAETLPLLSKAEVATRIIAEVIRKLG